MSADGQDIRRLALDLRGQASDVSDKLLEAEEKFQPLQQALADLQSAEIVGSASDGEVEATLNGMARVTAIYISPRAQRALDETALGSAIVDAIKAARVDVARHAKEKLEQASGEAIPDVADASVSEEPLQDLLSATAQFEGTRITPE